ncbi:transcription initiation factor TFIIF small subunit [Coniosporium apollinis CBS 100218]|uniref:Transcription initiation factor TFIIF small subunit n=1 Tax=Coniosporium apollinis (strain CBS 100218) TaxID=1168221 RepID=R7YQ78_CONA1|nr:transcription initiation factor TFIIF small subunit [Coniosporium apollinis CBS 100218]EON63974.1 transcription initiation factor TFIIF small subunit [Coniosporium apollinis CBS 100218]
MEGFPMRAWSIEIYLVNEHGEEVPANIFDKAQYRLHPSFEKRALQTIKQPPFRIQEKGWGEFDMQITLTAKHKGGDNTLDHDLNFQKERYEAVHTVTFRNPKPDLLALLRESGPAGDENGIKGKPASKKNKKEKTVDMEKLADSLQRLSEDDLLQVVQMVHDHKTQETYIKNDVENGEFHVDLYTLPDALIKMLWEFATEKAGGLQ